MVLSSFHPFCRRENWGSEKWSDLPRVTKLVGASPSRALARHRRTGVPRGKTVSPLRAETHCLVPRGSQGHQPIQGPGHKKNPGLVCSPLPGSPSTRPANSGCALQPGWGIALREWPKPWGRQLLECDGRMQRLVSHFTPPPRCGPGYNLLPSSLGFLLAGGWWGSHP